MLLLAAAMMYHFAYQSGSIAVNVNYQTKADRYGFAGISSGNMTIRNGSRQFDIDLAQLMPIAEHHILLSRNVNEGCGTLQPLAVRGHYVVVETIWAEKGCRAAAYFVDASSGELVETVDLDHRWDHRLDIQPAHFDGKPVVVESVDYVTLALATFDYSGRGKNGSVPWLFAIVYARDLGGNQRLFAYEYTKTHLDRLADPGWNIFPSAGSTAEVGPLVGLYPYAYLPNPDVLRMSAADDARYARLQPPTSMRETRATERNEWFELSDDEASKYEFAAALAALAKVAPLDDDASLRAGEAAFYGQCRVLLKAFEAGKISAASARTAWLNNGCRLLR